LIIVVLCFFRKKQVDVDGGVVGAPLVQVDGKVFVNLQQGKLSIDA
jgi:hypothetical protein